MPDSLDQAISELKEVAPIINRQTSAMKVREADMFSLTVGQLLALCDKYKEHPLSQTFKDGVAGQPATSTIVVERIDLLALIENKDIEFFTQMEELDIEGRPVVAPIERKRLVARGQAKKVDVAPVVAGLRGSVSPLAETEG